MELRQHSRRFTAYVNTISLAPEALAATSRADILRKVRSAFEGREKLYGDVTPDVLRRVVWRPEVRRLAWKCMTPGCGKPLGPGASKFCSEHAREVRRDQTDLATTKWRDKHNIASVLEQIVRELWTPPVHVEGPDLHECGGRFILDQVHCEWACNQCYEVYEPGYVRERRRFVA
jgi:hypothetical protein